MKQGNLNILKSAKMLLDSTSISKHVVLMFDETYLQKREEYAGGELVGADTDGNLYKGIMCFMIVGWIEGEIEKLVKDLHGIGFRVST